jgi:hypothetical protein
MDPWSRPHEVSDDLESFFWVLMYEVVRYRNDKAKDFAEAMQFVFDTHTAPDKAGVVRGGDGKLICVFGYKLSRKVIRGLVKTPCRKIIEEMRSLFRELYCDITEGNASDTESGTDEDEDRELEQRAKDAREKLRTSKMFLEIIEKHLGSDWDIDNDGSLDISESQPDHSASRNRRKRKAEDSGDNEDNWHVRRVGRYPPKSSIRRSGDDHSTQTSITSSHHNSPFSTSRDIPSSTLISSGSLRSRKDGPPVEQ